MQKCILKKKTIKKKAPKPKPKPIRPMAGKRASVPLAPPPPPPPPPPPSVPSAVPNKRASAAINVLKPTPKPEVDVQTQLQNIKLKKVTKEENKDKNLGGTGKNFLQNALSEAIKNRRQNLHMHDDDNDDEEEDDWD